MDLGEAVPFNDNTYLGCTQVDVEPDHNMIQEKRDLIAKVMATKTNIPEKSETETKPVSPGKPETKTETKSSNKTNKKQNKQQRERT